MTRSRERNSRDAQTAASIPEWRRKAADAAYQAAVEHQREARRLRDLANKILNPPEGVTVECGSTFIPGGRAPSSVRFVGPVRDA